MRIVKSKNFKRFVIGLAAVSILAISLVYLLRPEPLDNATLQLSKIDFLEKPDSANLLQILNSLQSMDGVKSVHYFADNNSLVTSFENTITNTNQIVAAVTGLSSVPVKPYIVPPGDKTRGCPIHQSKFIFSWLKQLIF